MFFCCFYIFLASFDGLDGQCYSGFKEEGGQKNMQHGTLGEQADR